MSSGWIGVDLDGTLAWYDGWVNCTHIGRPIEPMVKRVKFWLANGRDVRIFTARAFTLAGDRIDEACDAIDAFALEHIGRKLPITNRKDMRMIELWDDRCVQVIANIGLLVGKSTRGLA